jgi:hypothetical protein
VQCKRVRNSVKTKRLIAESRKSNEKPKLDGLGRVFRMGAGGWGGGENPSRLRVNIKNGSMDFDYCQGNSTIIGSFERETRKWRGLTRLAGNSEFSETVVTNCSGNIPSAPISIRLWKCVEKSKTPGAKPAPSNADEVAPRSGPSARNMTEEYPTVCEKQNRKR